MARIGVFVCHCGENISATVDCGKVAQVTSDIPGVVVSVEKAVAIRYPVVVRFDSVNYSGTNTNNFSVSELIDLDGEE